MPGITAIGAPDPDAPPNVDAPPNADAPPVRDLETDDEEDDEEDNPQAEAEPEPEPEPGSKRGASTTPPASRTRSKKKLRNIAADAAAAAQQRKEPEDVDDPEESSDASGDEGGESEETSNPPLTLKVFPPGLDIFKDLHPSVYENAFCDLVGLGAAHKYIPYSDDDDVSVARNELKAERTTSGFPHILDFQEIMLVDGVTMASLLPSLFWKRDARILILHSSDSPLMMHTGVFRVWLLHRQVQKSSLSSSPLWTGRTRLVRLLCPVSTL